MSSANETTKQAPFDHQQEASEQRAKSVMSTIFERQQASPRHADFLLAPFTILLASEQTVQDVL